MKVRVKGDDHSREVKLLVCEFPPARVGNQLLQIFQAVPCAKNPDFVQVRVRVAAEEFYNVCLGLVVGCIRIGHWAIRVLGLLV